MINNTVKIKGNRGRNSQIGEEREAEEKRDGKKGRRAQTLLKEAFLSGGWNKPMAYACLHTPVAQKTSLLILAVSCPNARSFLLKK